MTHKWIKIYELKCLCKEIAKQIKEYRIEAKKVRKEVAGKDWREAGAKWAELSKKYPLADSHQYRLHHIAHCLLRGKTYEQIENKVREENKLKQKDWDAIEKIRAQYQEIPQEVTI